MPKKIAKKKPVKKTTEPKAKPKAPARQKPVIDIPAIIDRLAEEHGISRKDVLKFPALLKQHKLKPEQVTMVDVDRAEKIHREAMRNIIETHGANRPRIIPEFVDPIEEKKPERKPKKEKPERKPKKEKPEPKPKREGPSNKEIVYKAWLKAKDKSPKHAGRYFKLVEERVKLNTIVTWIKEWTRGSNLPACAKH